MKQNTTLAFPAHSRGKGWAVYRRKVVVIEVENNQSEIRIRTGFINSTSTSHEGVDNVYKTIVWLDKAWNDIADNADDAHEQSYAVQDPRLLGVDEIGLLRYPELGKVWFGGWYEERTLTAISMAAAAVKFPE